MGGEAQTRKRAQHAGGIPSRRRCSQSGLRTGERPLHGVQHKVVHLARIAESDFELRRVRVDIHQLRVEREVQGIGSVPPVVQNITVPEPDRIHQQPVAHAAAVDEPELLIRLRARRGRQTEPAAQRHRPRGMLDGDRAGGEVLAEHLRKPPGVLALPCRCGGLEQHALAVSEAESHVES